MKHWLKDVAIAAACVLSAVAPAVVAATFTGNVILADTGKPAAGAWVVGHWESGGGLAHSSSGCSISVTQADANGKYELKGGSRGLLWMLGPTPKPWVFAYLPGYGVTRPASTDSESYVLLPFTGTESLPAIIGLPGTEKAAEPKRLRWLDQLMRWMDCGSDETFRVRHELRPMVEAMTAEGRDIVASNPQWERWLRTMQKDRERLQSDTPVP